MLSVFISLALVYAVWLYQHRTTLQSLRVATASKVKSPPTIDGVLEPDVWGQTPWTTDFVLSDGSAEAPHRARARILWTDDAVYFGFQVDDSDIYAPHQTRDDPLYAYDVVEVFIDPEGDGRDYFEFEVSPRGTLFDAKFPTHRQHLERSKRFDASSFIAAVSREPGQHGGDINPGYTVEMQVRFSDLGLTESPKPGDRWRINLFRIDYHDRKHADYTAWTAPLIGDFHALDRFGELVFAQ